MCAGYTLTRTGTYARKDAPTQACTRARGGLSDSEDSRETHDVALELALGVDDRVVQHGHRRDDVPARYSEYSYGAGGAAWAPPRVAKTRRTKRAGCATTVRRGTGGVLGEYWGSTGGVSEAYARALQIERCVDQ
jgi:hypothetical protein